MASLQSESRSRLLPGINLSGQPPHLLLSTWLAESAWIYLVTYSLVFITNPGTVLSPAVVPLPYGMAILVDLLIGRRRRRVPGPQSSALGPILWEVAATLLSLLAGAGCLAAMVWRQLYPNFHILDPSWPARVMEDARGALNVVPPLVWLVILGMFLWWRGAHLARKEGDFPELATRFLWGSALLLGFALLGAPFPSDAALTIWLFACYAMFGLTAVAIARLRAAQSERLGGVDGRWLGWSPLLAFLLLSAGFGLTLLLYPQLELLAIWLRDWLTGVLIPALVEALKWIAHMLGLDKPPQPLPVELKPASPPSSGDNFAVFSLPDGLREIGRQLFTLSWIIILLFSFYSWISHWYWGRRRGSGGSMSRERLPWRFSFNPLAILWWILSALLRRWPSLSRWIRLPARAKRGARTVRDLYRGLLEWGARNGEPRNPWATPREYQHALSNRWPQLNESFRVLTDSYHQARYGRLPMGQPELRAAQDGWQRITEFSRQQRPRKVRHPRP